MWLDKRYVIAFVFIFLSNFGEANQRNGGFEKACSLNVDEDLTKTNQPLMLAIKNAHEYELVLPEKNNEESVINMKRNDRFVLFCPGQNNVLKMLRRDTAITTCQRNRLQLLKGPKIVKETKEFQCSNQITPEIRNTGKTCGDHLNANVYEIGYNVLVEHNAPKWFAMLSACHNAQTMDTLYSIYTVYGKSIDARQRNVPRPRQFSPGNLKELYDGKSPNRFYTKESVTETLRKLLQRADVSQYIDSADKFISRGHLAPDADMLLSSWKIATYMFINVAPQWQTINAGNWLKVENKVRDIADWSKHDFIVITGTYGIMTLDDKNGKPRQIHLNPPDKLRIPDYFWKVVYRDDEKTAIAIITSNNPYLNRIEPMCDDICEPNGWWSKEFHNLQKGYTYCCAYSQFKNIVPYVPHLEVRANLKMPDKPLIVRFRSSIKKVIKNIRQRKNKPGRTFYDESE